MSARSRRTVLAEVPCLFARVAEGPKVLAVELRQLELCIFVPAPGCNSAPLLDVAFLLWSDLPLVALERLVQRELCPDIRDGVPPSAEFMLNAFCPDLRLVFGVEGPGLESESQDANSRAPAVLAASVYRCCH